jgi:hypothetical protein
MLISCRSAKRGYRANGLENRAFRAAPQQRAGTLPASAEALIRNICLSPPHRTH